MFGGEFVEVSRVVGLVLCDSHDDEHLAVLVRNESIAANDYNIVVSSYLEQEGTASR